MTDPQLLTPIVLPKETYKVNQQAIQLRDEALGASALIGKVENAAQNEQCVTARKRIKGLTSLFESERKKMKEPILELGRQLDRIVAVAVLELEKEEARLGELEREFIIAERRRVQEEQAAQQREIERIERERQAELDRIAREQREREEAARRAQAEADRIAREAREAAEKLAREEREAAEKAARYAITKKEREATAKQLQEIAERERQAALAALEAEKAAQANRERQEAILAEQRKVAEAQAQNINATAEALTYAENRPVEITRAAGQAVREEWVISSINDFQLMKARPDLVRKIEWDLTALKQALTNANGKLPGVTAHKDIKVQARGARVPSAIDV